MALRRKTRLTAERKRRIWIRSRRRGVLLLVVFSVLVLFMLIGTAFVMSSRQLRDAAKASATLNRVGSFPTKLLDRALYQILRDTENPFSVVRYHSLLRDLNGTDGFEAVAHAPLPADFDATFSTAISQTVRYSGATLAEPFGPAQGQLVDIYVAITPDRPYAAKLERDILGHTVPYELYRTKGYYNGCLLTVVSGPAAGSSARIVDYDVAGDAGITLARFRVMNVARADGTPLAIGTSDKPPQRVPELVDLAGATFIVNGRTLNGTGVGYNPFAAAGMPRLTALQLMRLGDTTLNVGGALSRSNSFGPLCGAG